MQPTSSSMWFSHADDGLHTPRFLAGSRRILNDADECPSAHGQSPSEAKRARHSYPQIPLRQSVHDLPRPQSHGQAPHFHHQPLLPPLTVSSISPPNSSRPLYGLAPLRSVPRRCRHLGCHHAAKIHDLCPDHHQQQQHYNLGRQFANSPLHAAVHAMRPTLPPVHYEFSMPSLGLTSPSFPSSGHHHMRPGMPLLPALRTVLSPMDSQLSPSYTIPSPASSTSSYSSYGQSSEASAVPTPRASTSPRRPAFTRVSTSSNKPTTKCRREHCVNAARRKGLCMEHGGRHFCKMDGCAKCAHRGGFCISHGGGRRCAIANCAKSAQSGGICYSHGGGKRCATDGCTHAARSGGFCIKHGKQQQISHESQQ